MQKESYRSDSEKNKPNWAKSPKHIISKPISILAFAVDWLHEAINSPYLL